jgi:DNA-binding NtrC family response regulator
MKPTPKIKIFLVDDDILFVKSLKHLLKDKRAEIKAFECGEECLKNLKESPNIIILDYALNNSLNGIQILNKIKHSSPDTRVIMVSGNRKPGIIDDAFKYGGYDYISKGEEGMLELQKEVKQICDEIESTELLNKERRELWWLNAGVILLVLLMYVINRLK